MENLTYALLDTGSESTLIRGDFMRKLRLKGKAKIVNISSIRDTGKAIWEWEQTKHDTSGVWCREVNFLVLV